MFSTIHSVKPASNSIQQISQKEGNQVKANTTRTRLLCTLAATGIGGIGVILLVTTLEPIGKMGNLTVRIGGGFAVCVSVGIIWIAIRNCKNKEGQKSYVKCLRNEPIRLPDPNEMEQYCQKQCQRAIEFAKQKLLEHPNVKPRKFGYGQPLYQPINRDIAVLREIYCKYHMQFLRIVAQGEENPWISQEVIQAADVCMKISCALGCFVVQDMPTVKDRFIEAEDKRNNMAKILTVKEGAFWSDTFPQCAHLYHKIRGHAVFMVDSNRAHGLCPDFNLIFPKPDRPIPKEYEDLFYQIGTVQFQWRILFNDYCNRLWSIVTKEEMKSADFYDLNDYQWCFEDQGPQTFSRRYGEFWRKLFPKEK